jgi:hypothetical protein
MFEADSKEIERKFDSIYREIKLPCKQELLYGLMWKFPVLYRMYRIRGDRTMLDWEKERKWETKERGHVIKIM